LDHDLDVYASSVGLTKTAVQLILGDEGMRLVVGSHITLNDILSDISLELGDLDPEKVFFEPMQKSLDQCKSAKIVSR
jgi:dynactin 1